LYRYAEAAEKGMRLGREMDAEDDPDGWLDAANYPSKREGWLLGMGPENAHTTSDASSDHRRPPALVAWLTPPNDDVNGREARMLRASRPMGEGVAGGGGAPPDAFMHERVWAEDYALALGASRHQKRSGESVPGGPHGPVALNLLSRQLQLMAILAGMCSIALPAYAYFAVYRSYIRLWPVSFSVGRCTLNQVDP
jgi:hypothetical protein